MDGLRPGSIDDGTAIGNALATAVNRLRESRRTLQGGGPHHRRRQQRRADLDRSRPPSWPAPSASASSPSWWEGGPRARPRTTTFFARALAEHPGRPRAAPPIARITGGMYTNATDRATLEHGLQDVLDRMEKTRLFEAGGPEPRARALRRAPPPGLLAGAGRALPLGARAGGPSRATPAEPALAFRLLGELVRLLEPGALKLLLAVAAVAVLAGFSLSGPARRPAARGRPARAAPRADRGAGAPGGPARAGGAGALAPGPGPLPPAVRVAHRGDPADWGWTWSSRWTSPARCWRATWARTGSPAPGSSWGRCSTGWAATGSGLVLFAGRAFPACPLTTDLQAFRVFLREAGPDSVPEQGTGLAAALQAAREVLESEQHGARSRVVLLVSDGEDQGAGSAAAAAALGRGGHPRVRAGGGRARGRAHPARRMRRARRRGTRRTAAARRSSPARRADAGGGGREGQRGGVRGGSPGPGSGRAPVPRSTRLARSELAGRTATSVGRPVRALRLPGAPRCCSAALLLPEARRRRR